MVDIKPVFSKSWFNRPRTNESGASRSCRSLERKTSRWALLLLPSLLLVGVSQLAQGQSTKSSQQWVATWATSPQQSRPGAATPAIDGQTIRQRMRVTIGGNQLRVRLSNAFGENPLVIGKATVGIAGEDAASVKPGSLQPVTFGGKPSITIAPGAPALSDPIAINVPAGALVSISLYLPGKLDPSYTVHSLGLRTAIISPPGDFTDKDSVPKAVETTSSFFVSALSVPKSAEQFAIVAFGDSITDGTTSTVDADASWPAQFAQRLAKGGLQNKIAIVNQGIGGNQLRRDFAGVSAQARFESDALSMPGTKYIVLLEGINDLGFPGAKMGDMLLAPADSMPSAADIIAVYQQLIARAHEQGIKIIGATLTPWKGTRLPGYYEDSKEPVREAVNEWIRSSGAFDAVIDFDAAIRDPADPHRALAPLVSPDQLHPSDAGYKKMAESIDLSVFGVKDTNKRR